MSVVVACVKPTPLGEPAVARGQLALEGQPWGLRGSERRVVAAARLAAQALGAEVVAVAAGPGAMEPGLREALALGAARAALLRTEARLDAAAVARALADHLRPLAPALVLAGQASPDAAQGLVGPMLAEALGLEMLAGVERLQGLHAERSVGGQRERFEVRPPALLTVSPRFAPAGHATSWGVGEAYGRPLEVRPFAAAPALAEARSLARADEARGEAERFDGDPEEAAAQLVRRLRALGVAP